MYEAMFYYLINYRRTFNYAIYIPGLNIEAYFLLIKAWSSKNFPLDFLPEHSGPRRPGTPRWGDRRSGPREPRISIWARAPWRKCQIIGEKRGWEKHQAHRTLA